jgi:two-component system, cell cycle response regulator DivK
MSRVLLVEDDAQNAQLVSSLLKMLGHEVIWLTNGDKFIETVRHVLPSVVILDMRLPGMFNGWELARFLKKDTLLQAIPILALSVEVEPDDRSIALQAGCDGYLAKPYDIRALREWVQQAVGLNQTA